jgi:exonuclease III
MKTAKVVLILLLCSILFVRTVSSQTATEIPKKTGPVAFYTFDGRSTEIGSENINNMPPERGVFVKGVEGKALQVNVKSSPVLPINSKSIQFDTKSDFSVQFWIRTTMDAKKPFVIISHKEFKNNDIASQRNAGWVLYSHAGTWAWNMGSGKRRITHERDNGKYQPLNDGEWHQLSMSYNSKLSEIRLYYDGDNKATYHVLDSVGFDFANEGPLVAGWAGSNVNSMPEIVAGQKPLQDLVNAFNNLNVGHVVPEQFVDLIVDPRELFFKKRNELKIQKGADSAAFLALVKDADLALVTKSRGELMKNPYTVYQIKEFMELAPLLKIYSLVGDKVIINQSAVASFIESEKLNLPDFELDNLGIWDRTLSSEEVVNSYKKYFKPVVPILQQKLSSIIAADWNIWHGGKHWTVSKDGWDSRVRIAEMLKKENADVIMMQETYSSGDFIAAELGYYFATTVDWDYLNQGANISVLSRYPIKELYVPKGAPFMNVAVKIGISKTQDLYVMSNWYGMNQFPAVYNFNRTRFAEADNIPTLFAGDFNAIPHTDGGKSPASRKMLDEGFIDAYRSLYPDLEKYPGYTHRSGKRIDQLYYKGKGLTNISTKVVSNWIGGFPSDHFLVISKFGLNYSTVDKK